MKKYLNDIEDIYGKKFVEVKGGIASFVKTGEVIPIELISHNKVWEDGFYRVTEGVCRGEESGCAIGKPAQKCIDRNSVSKNSCAKYGFTRLRNVPLVIMVDRMVDILREHDLELHDLKEELQAVHEDAAGASM